MTIQELQPMDTAPKDGTVLLSFWNDVPVFIGYGTSWNTSYEYKSFFDRMRGRKTKIKTPTGERWRVLSWSPRIGWGWNGNCGSFNPPGWMPIPKASEVIQ